MLPNNFHFTDINLNGITVQRNLRRTSKAVNRLLGSLTSIFLTKSFALSEILGHGSDEKSRSLFKMASNISCSDSITKDQDKCYTMF